MNLTERRLTHACYAALLLFLFLGTDRAQVVQTQGDRQERVNKVLQRENEELIDELRMARVAK